MCYVLIAIKEDSEPELVTKSEDEEFVKKCMETAKLANKSYDTLITTVEDEIGKSRPKIKDYQEKPMLEWSEAIDNWRKQERELYNNTEQPRYYNAEFYIF